MLSASVNGHFISNIYTKKEGHHLLSIVSNLGLLENIYVGTVIPCCTFLNQHLSSLINTKQTLNQAAFWHGYKCFHRTESSFKKAACSVSCVHCASNQWNVRNVEAEQLMLVTKSSSYDPICYDLLLVIKTCNTSEFRVVGSYYWHIVGNNFIAYNVEISKTTIVLEGRGM